MKESGNRMPIGLDTLNHFKTRFDPVSLSFSFSITLQSKVRYVSPKRGPLM